MSGNRRPVEVAIAVRRPVGEYLVLLRSPEKLGYWHLVSVGVEWGEEPAAAAARELLEETGYAGAIRPAGSVVDSAYSTRERHTFVATGCRRIQEPSPQGGEFPEVVLLSLPEFREHLRGGRLTDVAGGYAGLDALSLL